MDGTANLASAAMLRSGGGPASCTLKVVRDVRGGVCDLAIMGIDSPSFEPAHVAELVGRSLRDVFPTAADDLAGRLDAAKAGEVVRSREASAGAARPDLDVSVRPASQPDMWVATFTPVSSEAPADARLRELNHRVLNSLAMLSSIIGIETRAVSDRAGRAALERVRSRLVAVSNLYRILSAAESAPVIRADLYLRSVADAVSASVGSGDRIEVEVRAAPWELTTNQAASLGLITNEAMTNAYKHAFGGRSNGRIVVSLNERGEGFLLCVSDDGGGMPKEARTGLGTTLIEALAIDLAGEVTVRSSDEGTSLRIAFPRIR